MLGGNFIKGSCLGSSCPGRNYLGVIFGGAEVQGVIILGGVSFRAIVRGEVVQEGLVRGNCSECKSLVSNCPGGNFMGGAIVWGQFSRIELLISIGANMDMNVNQYRRLLEVSANCFG